MRPYNLKPGDRFRIPNACDPAETAHLYEVMSIEVKTAELSGREVPVKVLIDARIDDGPVESVAIGPWVEVVRM